MYIVSLTLDFVIIIICYFDFIIIISDISVSLAQKTIKIDIFLNTIKYSFRSYCYCLVFTL